MKSQTSDSRQQSQENPNSVEETLPRKVAGWLLSYGTQHYIRIMLIGLTVTIVTALYVTFWVPRDGYIDIRESFLGVAGIATGFIMIFWPLIHALFFAIKKLVAIAVSVINQYAFLPLKNWLSKCIHR